MALIRVAGLILLDLSMPQMDGFEVAERIKADSETHHIPFNIITGNNGSELLAQALGSCADDFISKTAASSEIIARMQYHLKRKRMLDQMKNDQLDCQETVSINPEQLAMALNRLKEASLEVIFFFKNYYKSILYQQAP
jgi:cyclic di-GMP phosphodiesterase